MSRKILLALVCLALLLPVQSAFSEDGKYYEPTYGSRYGHGTVKKPLWVGLGLSYIFETLDINDLTEEIKPVGLDADFDNSFGARLSIGYKFTGIFGAEFTLDWMDSFEWSGSYYYKGKPVSANMSVDVQMAMLSGRIQPPIGKLDWFSPYFTIGGGAMMGEVQTDAKVFGKNRTYINWEAHPVTRIGAGVDFFVTDSISVGLDTSYYWGWNEWDEIKFVSVTGNTAYHF